MLGLNDERVFYMGPVIRSVLTAPILVGLCVAAAGCGPSGDGPNSVDVATAVVAAHLPSGWTVGIARIINCHKDIIGAIGGEITPGHGGVTWFSLDRNRLRCPGVRTTARHIANRSHANR
jgi:hypothetical protein